MLDPKKEGAKLDEGFMKARENATADARQEFVRIKADKTLILFFSAVALLVGFFLGHFLW